jgi:hypothetical protein
MSHHGGGVCIYVRSDLNFTTINVTQFCDEMNIEICAIKITARNTNIIVLCVYSSPSGNFDHFVNTLDTALKSLYKSKIEFILCGDFNVNFLGDSGCKLQLALFMQSYNIFHTVEFPTGVGKNTSTAIDNIIIDRARINSFKVTSISNGLSDHDAQCLVLLNNLNSIALPYHKIRVINKETINYFIETIKKETLGNIYTVDHTNDIFNVFLNIFLIHFESCFPIQYVTKKQRDNNWITPGIRISCKRKRSLYVLSKASNNLNIKSYYLLYSKILREVIRKAKLMYYNNIISQSDNKSKTSWRILRNEKGVIKKTRNFKLYTKLKINV